MLLHHWSFCNHGMCPVLDLVHYSVFSGLADNVIGILFFKGNFVRSYGLVNERILGKS